MVNAMTEWLKRRKMAAAPAAPGAELTPYAVLLATPAGFDCADRLNPDAYRGLLYAESLGAAGGGDGRLLTVWRDRPAYEAAASAFLKNTGLPPQVLWEGFHLDNRRPGRPWWRRLTPAGLWAVVATLSLVLTNLQTIWSGYGWLVGPASVETTVSTDAPADATNPLIGEPFHFEADVHNTRLVGDCSVEFTGASADRPGGLAFDPMGGGSHPGVKPDGTAALTVSGKGLEEGEYQVIVKGRATAGVLFPGRRDFESPPVKIRVWREEPYVPPGRVKKVLAGGKACEAAFELRAGRESPGGFDVGAVLQGFGDVRFFGVQFPGTTRWELKAKAGNPGEQVAYLDWTTPRLPPKHATPFTLAFETTAERGKTAAEWEEVVQATHCDCEGAAETNVIKAQRR